MANLIRNHGIGCEGCDSSIHNWGDNVIGILLSDLLNSTILFLHVSWNSKTQVLKGRTRIV